MRTRALMVSAMVLGLVVSASAKEVTVKVGHNSLDPAEVAIAKGDTVTFTNTAEMPGGHTIVADDGSFSSPALGKDKSWSRAFAEPGTYAIHIKEHPSAKGAIVVK